MKQEIEASYLSINKTEVRNKLAQAGFKLIHPEYLMRRISFALPSDTKGMKWGRVRQEADKITMAVKEMRGRGIKDVYETEVEVNDYENACSIFEACGIEKKSYQENLREEWGRENVQVTIDTWPGLDPLIEIEGENEKTVKQVSKELGFEYEKAIFGSSDVKYEKETGIPAEEIRALKEVTFKNPPQKKTA